MDIIIAQINVQITIVLNKSKNKNKIDIALPNMLYYPLQHRMCNIWTEIAEKVFKFVIKLYFIFYGIILDNYINFIIMVDLYF